MVMWNVPAGSFRCTEPTGAPAAVAWRPAMQRPVAAESCAGAGARLPPAGGLTETEPTGAPAAVAWRPVMQRPVAAESCAGARRRLPPAVVYQGEAAPFDIARRGKGELTRYTY